MKRAEPAQNSETKRAGFRSSQREDIYRRDETRFARRADPLQAILSTEISVMSPVRSDLWNRPSILVVELTSSPNSPVADLRLPLGHRHGSPSWSTALPTAHWKLKV